MNGDVMHPNEDVIHDYIDGTLDAGARADVERHLAECETCRQLADDLAEIRQVAGSLEDRQPPDHAWARLEAAIANEPRTTSTSTRRPSLTWWAAAAVLVLATGIGVRYTLQHRNAATPAATTANGSTAAPSAEAVEAELRAAESHYDKAIKGLEQIAHTEQGALDPKTAATLQKNLAVIDQAISESRAAIRAQPASEPAVDSLMTNFKAKLSLLQDTVALINEMRKGDDAGTARIVSGLKQKGT